MKILLDMDGVLAEFVGAAFQVHGKDPSVLALPENVGIFEIEQIWGITPDQFWAPIDATPEFWEGLDKTDEADEIVRLAEEAVGPENVAILTAPHTSPACIPGKYAWLNRNYPQFRRRIIFGNAKEFMASPERILVDDRDENISGFVAAGGHGVLVPRLWNAGHVHADEAMRLIRLQMEYAMKRVTDGK